MIVALKLSQPHGITPTTSVTCRLRDGTAVEIPTAANPYLISGAGRPMGPEWIFLNQAAAGLVWDPRYDIIAVEEVAPCTEEEEA
jgi:hypothetical protein